MNININGNNLTIAKPYLTQDEAQLVLSLGAAYDGTSVVIELHKTSRLALQHLLKELIPGIVKQTKTDDNLQKMFAYIKKYYDQLDAIIKQKIDANCLYSSKLMPHQVESVKFGLYRKYSLLALQQRLGKSIVTLTIDKLMRIYHPELDKELTLIVCPSIAKYQWLQQIAHWGFNQNKALVIDSNSQNINYFTLMQFKFVIINYELLQKYLHELCAVNIWHVVFDECQYIKSIDSARFKASKTICEIHNKRTARFKITFLSGTPMKNRADDFFAYFNLSKHFLGKSKKRFDDSFLDKIKFNGSRFSQVLGSKNQELLAKLLSNFMIRYKRKDVSVVPVKNYQRYYFEFDDNDIAYKKAIKEFDNATSDFAQSTALMRVNMITAMSKRDGVCDLIQQFIDDGDKVAVFSFFKDVLNKINTKFQKNSVLIDGSVNPKRKFELTQKFQTDPDINVFAGQTISSGVAIDLSVCDNIIFVDMPVGYADLEQVIFRLENLSKDRGINIYFSIAKGTIDERVCDILLSKADDTSIILDGGDKELESFNKLTKLFAIKKQTNEGSDTKENQREAAEF